MVLWLQTASDLENSMVKLSIYLEYLKLKFTYTRKGSITVVLLSDLMGYWDMVFHENASSSGSRMGQLTQDKMSLVINLMSYKCREVG